jgi:hypothetical protein
MHTTFNDPADTRVIRGGLVLVNRRVSFFGYLTEGLEKLVFRSHLAREGTVDWRFADIPGLDASADGATLSASEHLRFCSDTGFLFNTTALAFLCLTQADIDRLSHLGHSHHRTHFKLSRQERRLGSAIGKRLMCAHIWQRRIKHLGASLTRPSTSISWIGTT